MNNKIKQVIEFPAKVLEPVKNYLQREEKRLKKRKEQLEEEDPFSDPERANNNAVDTDALEQAGHERVEAIKEEVDKALITVRKSLTRIKLGSYGLCEKCGKMIDTDRLAVNPTAIHCIECVRKQEKKNKK